MSKTIHDRLYDLHLAETKWLRIDNALIPATTTEADAAMNAVNAMDENIATPWNAAVEAMKAMVKHEQFPEPGYGWRCNQCKRVRSAGHQDTCLVAALQAALALMEGNSPSRDEAMADDTHPEHELDDEYYERVVRDDHHSAMLEDKRYERDDIYKK